MRDLKFFDRTGHEVSDILHAALREDHNYCSVKVSLLADGSVVSTVWLGRGYSEFYNRWENFETIKAIPLDNDEFEWKDAVHHKTEAEALEYHNSLID